MIRKYKIRQVVFTGTNTDPQLYQYEARLLTHLREQLPPETQFSLHTNGRLVINKIESFNQYDRAAVSLPSFEPNTYKQMMGVPGPPDLEEILRRARIPVKISCLVTAENKAEFPLFLDNCHQLGVRRVVLRKRFGVMLPWDALISIQELALTPRFEYRTNPVYDFQGMEVTLWDFDQSTSKSINLFASGLISSSYHLTEVPCES
jgi:MoaA/NifB/PqqE/SkfB family radical SAM enzyme